jgi:hypothetical protein
MTLSKDILIMIDELSPPSTLSYELSKHKDEPYNADRLHKEIHNTISHLGWRKYKKILQDAEAKYELKKVITAA